MGRGSGGEGGTRTACSMQPGVVGVPGGGPLDLALLLTSKTPTSGCCADPAPIMLTVRLQDVCATLVEAREVEFIYKK